MAASLFASPSAFVAAAYEPSVLEPVVGVAAYVGGIALLKRLPLPKLELKAVAVVHNVVLIVLSLAMGIGALTTLRERYALEGFDGLFCSQRPGDQVLDGAAGYWMKVYYLSKYYEFGDTVILALKKKDIIFLHSYHHAVMAFLTWSWCRFQWFEGSLWCVLVNSIIHFFMYIYYLLAALGQNVWWKRYLTAAQIFQFCTGFIYVSVFFQQSYARGCGPAQKLWVALPTHLVNCSFILLFWGFFKKGASKGAKAKADHKRAN